MRKTSILNKLIHKPQAIHGGQRVCEENKLELEKNDCQLKCFAVKQSTSEGHKRAVTRPFRMKLATKVVHNIKVLVISRLTVVSREAKKKQHACASSGPRDHYSELFTRMAALKF